MKVTDVLTRSIFLCTKYVNETVLKECTRLITTKLSFVYITNNTYQLNLSHNFGGESCSYRLSALMFSLYSVCANDT